jgi:hypothetical protein
MFLEYATLGVLKPPKERRCLSVISEAGPRGNLVGDHFLIVVTSESAPNWMEKTWKFIKFSCPLL